MSGDFLRRASIVFFVVLCLAFSQRAGWAVMGTMQADNQVRRDDAALKGNLVRGDLKTAAKDLEALAGVPSAGEAQAAIDALLAVYVKAGKGTVGALTDNCAKPDWAPQTCRKVAEARGVLEKAKRRDALRALVEGGAARLDGAEKVADGAADVAVPVGIFQRFGFEAGETDARFWSVVFVVAFNGLVATFGFALVGVRHEDIAHGRELIRRNPMVIVPLVFLIVEAGMNAIFGWRVAGGGLFNLGAWLSAAFYAGAAVLGAYLPTRWHAHAAAPDPLAAWDFGPVRLPPPAASSAPAADAASRERTGFDAGAAPGRPVAFGSGQDQNNPRAEYPLPPAAYPAGGGANLHGAPINIHFGLPAPSAPAAGQAQPPAVGSSAAAPAVVAPASLPAGVAMPPPPPALPAIAAPEHPVDRSAYEHARLEQEAIDRLLVFRTACVVDAPGAGVAGEDLYRRYWDWCGGAGLPRALFDPLFAKASGLKAFHSDAGPVWAGVTLRDSVQLRRA